jgi:RNA polymerase sigma factor (TIGR02999 family)
MEITRLLQRVEDGEREALHQLMPLVYEELKKLASRHLRRETGAERLGTTALVHESFLKLVKGRHPSYQNRAHFYGIVSRLMRQILVDTARRRTAEKRDAVREVTCSELLDRAPQPSRSVLAISSALKQLERADPSKAKMIEMSYFGGFTAEEISIALSMSVHMVRRELRLAKAWLKTSMLV